MSKAFTRESDDEMEMPVIRPRPPLPFGTKNYMTPLGETCLREEVTNLVQHERPKVAASGEAADVKRRLAVIDQRLLQLEESLSTAVVVPAPEPPWDTVRFGATVTVRDSQGQADTYRIVGVDEVDAERGWVSFLSPIAKALINARLGEKVRFRFPSGETQLEIVAVGYD